MTEAEFNEKWLHYRKETPLFSADFDSLLATVRDEARRAALEEAAVMCDKEGLHDTADEIRKRAAPARTLDDVLADILAIINGPAWSGPDDGAKRLAAYARTAVKGLSLVRDLLRGDLASTALVRLNEAVDKLTEIK